MEKFILVEHPKLKATATVSESAFTVAGGLESKGWRRAKVKAAAKAEPANTEQEG